MFVTGILLPSTMNDELLSQAAAHVRRFFSDARLTNKKWYREIADDEVWLYAFFVIRRRMMQPKHYVVHESGRLREAFVKPEVLRDYESLKRAWTEKGDLKKFHTENSKILYPIDGLLEDRGINHLHLDRSRYQVYFRTEGREIYVLHIVKHFGRGHTGYSKENLLRIMEESWPGRFGVSGLKNLRPDKASPLYPSRYGWHEVQRFRHWLETASQGKGPLTLTWEENEFFRLADAEERFIGDVFEV